MRENMLKEAREKLIEDVIAAPYTQAPWQFFGNLAERSRVQLGHPRIEPLGSMSVEKNKANIIVDMNSIGKNYSSAMWMFYHAIRSQWI
jgi:hypothetical protein